jgi:ATP-binding cassette subfamily C (CFTR/MRP) protein 1
MVNIDSMIIVQLKLIIQQFFAIIISFGLIIYSIYFFIIPLIPILIIYIIIQQIFRRIIREIKRIRSNSKSPMFSNFSESLNGLSTIRAYSLNKTFEKNFENKIDVMQKPIFIQNAMNMWLNFRLTLLGCGIVFFSSLIPVILFHYDNKNGISSSAAGLCITYSITITQILSNFIQNLINLEAEMNCVERYFSYYKKFINN